jgi:hypothetical protein
MLPMRSRCPREAALFPDPTDGPVAGQGAQADREGEPPSR